MKRVIVAPIRKWLVAAAVVALAASAAWTPSVLGQNFPTRAVTIIVPNPPGGSTDWMARALAQQLQGKWNQPVLVENKAGAGTKIANEYVARAKADGHTLLVITSAVAAGQVFEKDKSLDLEKAFAPLATMMYAPYVIIVPTEMPAKNLAEYLAYAKANPGKLNFAAVTNIGQMIDTYALFQLAGVKITVVPYNGGAPALRAVVANEVQGYFGATFGLQAQVAGGRIRALAVTSAKRFPLLADIPTIKEATGLDFDAGLQYGYATTAGTPREILAKLSTDILEIVTRPDIQEQVRKRGYEPTSLGQEELVRLIAREGRRAVETARLANIQPQ